MESKIQILMESKIQILMESKNNILMENKIQILISDLEYVKDNVICAINEENIQYIESFINKYDLDKLYICILFSHEMQCSILYKLHTDYNSSINKYFYFKNTKKYDKVCYTIYPLFQVFYIFEFKNYINFSYLKDCLTYVLKILKDYLPSEKQRLIYKTKPKNKYINFENFLGDDEFCIYNLFE